MKAFISYTRRDKDSRSLKLGRSLSQFLLSRGIDVTFDELSFKHGRTVATEMAAGIYGSDRFIFLASNAVLESKYVQNELEHARDRAIDIAPKPYFHIIILSEDGSVNCLPRDLKRFICHVFHNKSKLRLLYEVFLSLGTLTIGELKKKQIQQSSRAHWAYLERHQEIEILNDDGDTTFTDYRTVLNITDAPKFFREQMNWWATGSTPLPELIIKAFSADGRETKVEVIRELFRGNKTLRAQICFPQKIEADEVFSFTSQVIWPKAFNLYSGDDYLLDCEDKTYGFYRVDFSFPRYAKPYHPSVMKTVEKKCSRTKLKQMSHNKFFYTQVNLGLGTQLIFQLKTKAT